MRNWDSDVSERRQSITAPLKAAEYVRMSTDQQRYSTTAQSEAIHRYAADRGIEIVKSYEDAGKSGLNIEGRSALSQLLRDVLSGQAGFDIVLVYDVSRWGRFQDADESAHYEFICRQNGIHVEYCEEQFTNDGSPLSAVIKSIKRAMAGEYSRELSAKVYLGQSRLIRKGSRQGGQPGYGLRRTLIAEDGSIKGTLKFGDRKSLITDRVILSPGHPDEVGVVRQIFDLFVGNGLTRQAIAEELDRLNIPYDRPGPWTRPRVDTILTNVVYVGDSVWGKTSGKLSRRRFTTGPDAWVWAKDVFEPIIDRSLFDQAQAIVYSRVCRLSDEELLAGLKRLYAQHGTLSAELIDQAPWLPPAYTVSNRFDGLLHAYELVGHTPKMNALKVRTNRYLRKVRRSLINEIVSGFRERGVPIHCTDIRKPLLAGGEIGISVQVAKCLTLNSGSRRWRIRDFSDKRSDINVIAKMDFANVSPTYFYVIPAHDAKYRHFTASENDEIGLRHHSHGDLSSLFEMIAIS